MTSSLSRMRTAALAMIDGLRIVLVAIAVCLYGLGGTTRVRLLRKAQPYFFLSQALSSASCEVGPTPPLGVRLGGGAAVFVLGCGRGRRGPICANFFAAVRSLHRIRLFRRLGFLAQEEFKRG